MEKDKETLRRIMKTKEERYPDLSAERAARDAEELARLKAAGKAHYKQKKEEEELRFVFRHNRSLGLLCHSDHMMLISMSLPRRKKEYEAYSYDTLFATAGSGSASSGSTRGRGGGGGATGRGGRGGAAAAASASRGPKHFGMDDEADLMGLGTKPTATADATAARSFEDAFM
jgi:hypothetical protein